MTGAQLKKYMEWSARFYNTFNAGDLTISFNQDIRDYNYDFFDGVNYEINIANQPGMRIENLTWPDGTPVKNDDEFDVAVNNYRANSHLLVPSEIYDANDIPILVEMDIRGELGGIRELIRDYIVNVKCGVIYPENNNNWRITGNRWDASKHNKAVDLSKASRLRIPKSSDGRTSNVRAITESDLISCSL